MNKELSKNYIIYLLISVTVLISSNIIAVKQISIFGLVTSVSVIILPLLYLIITAVTKLYGKENARDLILFSIFANLIVSFIVAIAIDIPSYSGSNINIAFNTILDTNVVTTILSVVTYFIAGIANIEVVEKIKEKFNLISLIIIASGIAVIVDVVIFNTLNVITTQSFNGFARTIFNHGVIELLYIIILSPLFYYFIKENKKPENKKANK